MRPNPGPGRTASQKVIKDIRRAARRHYSAEDKIRIVLEAYRDFLGVAFDFQF